MNKIAGLRPDGKFTSALNDMQIQEVINAYETYHGSPVLAEQNLPYTRKTISLYWRKHGVITKMGRPKEFDRTLKLTKEWINELIITYKKNIEEVDREIKILEKVKAKYETIIEECLPIALGNLEETEDICNNKLTAEIFKEYGVREN
jgi:hypothetical protein